MLKRVVADVAVPIVDLFVAPLVLFAAIVMKVVRRLGIWRMPTAKRIFNAVGIYPIRDHYYEPMYNHKKYLGHSLLDARRLPGIELNEKGQLSWLNKFEYADELMRFPSMPTTDGSYYYKNPNFAEGDAECLYSLIRLCKPKRIIEIGSGFSTLMARAAISQNQREDGEYLCHHQCIEPFEMHWLEGIKGIEVIREKVEKVDLSLFQQLGSNDILFIDSSHMVRPQSDVLTECLEILPTLNKGVLVHIHDIFTPSDYLEHWLQDEVKFWNEQYLLEAFLSCNPHFEIIAAVNYLNRNFPVEVGKKFPMLVQNSKHIEPGSFWIRKVD
jgi:hypothetical protein